MPNDWDRYTEEFQLRHEVSYCYSLLYEDDATADRLDARNETTPPLACID